MSAVGPERRFAAMPQYVRCWGRTGLVIDCLETSKMTDAVEKGFFSSERARLIQDQAPVRNVDSKKPLFSIRLLHFPIPQLPRGDFFDSIDPSETLPSQICCEAQVLPPLDVIGFGLPKFRRGKPMTRRHFVFLFSSSAVWLLSARGHAISQPAAKVPRVGVLVSASEPHPFAGALRHGLQNLGYSEGRNIALDVRYTQGRSDLAAQFAAELVRSGVAIIVAHFTPAVKAAMAATKTIPIVMVAGAPLQSGFIKSLYEPGGNVTGLSAMDAELGGKRIQLLSDLIPKLACVGVLATTPTTDPFSRPFVADIQAAGAALNVRVAPVLIGGPSELEEAFSVLAKEGAQAVIVQGFFGPHSKRIAQLAISHRIGYMSTDRSAVVDGGLASISANFPVLYEYAAVYVEAPIRRACRLSSLLDSR
jgi:putative ABC transport system substrate-binding protein